MTGAHHRSRRRPQFTTGAAVAVIVLLGVTATVIVVKGSAAGGCQEGLDLAVATPPSMVAPLRAVVATVNDRDTTTGRRCLRVKLVPRASADVLEDLADGPGERPPVPDVWIPESADWLAIARSSARAASRLPTAAPAIASTPVVIASPSPMAEAAGWPETQWTWKQLANLQGDAVFWANAGHPEWGPFAVGLTDPARSMVGLRTVVGVTTAVRDIEPSQLVSDAFDTDRAVQFGILSLAHRASRLFGSDAELVTELWKAEATGAIDGMSAFPMSEYDLISFNTGVSAPDGQRPTTTLAASYPADGLFNAEVPFIVTTTADGDPARSVAAMDLLEALLGGEGQRSLTEAGLRNPAGAPTTFDAAVGVASSLPDTVVRADIDSIALGTARRFFRHVNQQGNTLAVLDRSDAMTEVVSGTDPPLTKMQVAVQAALTGVQYFPADDDIGLWMFSSDTPSGTGYQELSPLLPLDSPGARGTHKDDLIASQVYAVPGGNCSLYAATLAAFHHVTEHYQVGALNQVVLLVGGQDDGSAGTDLDGLVSQLQAEYDPERPVEIITIAFGADADTAALSRIAAATRARSHVSLDPREILGVFIDAITHAHLD